MDRVPKVCLFKYLLDEIHAIYSLQLVKVIDLVKVNWDMNFKDIVSCNKGKTAPPTKMGHVSKLSTLF